MVEGTGILWTGKLHGTSSTAQVVWGIFLCISEMNFGWSRETKKSSPKAWKSCDRNRSVILTSYALNDNFTDVTVVAADPTKLSRCHRVVLSAGSLFFESIFMGHAKRGPQDIQGSPYILAIPNISNETLLLVLTFIYTERVQVRKDQINDFVKVALQLKVRPLYENRAQLLRWSQDVQVAFTEKSKLLRETLGVSIIVGESPRQQMSVSAFASAQLQPKVGTPPPAAPSEYKTPNRPKTNTLNSPPQFWTSDDNLPMPLPLSLTMQVEGDDTLPESNSLNSEKTGSSKSKSGCGRKHAPIPVYSSAESIDETIESVVRSSTLSESSPLPESDKKEEPRKKSWREKRNILHQALEYYDVTKSITATLERFEVPRSTLTKHIGARKRAAAANENENNAAKTPKISPKKSTPKTSTPKKSPPKREKFNSEFDSSVIT